MDQSNQDHPTEEALERFVLGQCTENELEVIETHSLCCDFCVDRLEMLDVDIAATKLALQRLPGRQLARHTSTLASPRFLVASAALAAGFLGVVLPTPPSRVALSATRGSEEVTIVSTWRPLELHLDVKGLNQGLVIVQILDVQGATTWQGKANLDGQKDMNVRVPRFGKSGIYFVRICETARFRGGGELVREFVIRAQSPL